MQYNHTLIHTMQNWKLCSLELDLYSHNEDEVIADCGVPEIHLLDYAI